MLVVLNVFSSVERTMSGECFQVLLKIRYNDENAFLGFQWNSIINQPEVYKLILILYYIVIEFVFYPSNKV